MSSVTTVEKCPQCGKRSLSVTTDYHSLDEFSTCSACGYSEKSLRTQQGLESGKTYWFRRSKKEIWQVAYVAEAPEGAQWLMLVNGDCLQVREIDFNRSDFVEIIPPSA